MRRDLAEVRAHLGNLSRSLLRLHKALLDSERVSYERVHGRIETNGAFFQLVLGDAWFAWLRPLTTITVIVPADPWETAEAVKWAAAHEGPVYLRLSRMPVPNLDVPNRTFQPGKAEVVRQGDDLTIIACGTTVHLAVQAADALKEKGIAARVLNFSTINPLDETALHAAAATGAIVTVEEAGVRGGLGGAVSEFTAANTPVPVEKVGFPGFLPTGSTEWLFKEFGLSPEGIADAARRVLARKKG